MLRCGTYACVVVLLLGLAACGKPLLVQQPLYFKGLSLAPSKQLNQPANQAHLRLQPDGAFQLFIHHDTLSYFAQGRYRQQGGTLSLLPDTTTAAAYEAIQGFVVQQEGHRTPSERMLLRTRLKLDPFTRAPAYRQYIRVMAPPDDNIAGGFTDQKGKLELGVFPRRGRGTGRIIDSVRTVTYLEEPMRSSTGLDSIVAYQYTYAAGDYGLVQPQFLQLATPKLEALLQLPIDSASASVSLEGYFNPRLQLAQLPRLRLRSKNGQLLLRARSPAGRLELQLLPYDLRAWPLPPRLPFLEGP